MVTGAAGTVTITYTNNADVSNTTTITVNPKPTISGPACLVYRLYHLRSPDGFGNTGRCHALDFVNTAVATVSNAGVVTGVIYRHHGHYLYQQQRM